MKKLGVHGQRWLKAFHIFFSCVWIGAAICALILRLRAGNVIGINEFQGFYSAAVFVENLTIPSAVLTLITGLLLSWLTAWGFFKYWTVIFQLITAIVVILLAAIWLAPAADILKSLSGTEGLLARQNSQFQSAIRIAVGIGALNIVLLIVTIFVAAIKPWGKARKAKS